jgi:hypothetical protein
MSAMFKDAGDQALRGAAKSFANGHGVKDSAALEQQLAERISTLAKGMDLSPATLRQLGTIVLTNAERVAKGAHTQATTDDWSRQSIADLKSRHVSLTRVHQIIHATNAWLKAKHPAINEALKRDGSLGSHPLIVRHLTDRYLQHEHEAARSARAAKWPAKATADQVASEVSPGGILAGRRDPASALSAKASKRAAAIAMCTPPSYDTAS